VDDGSQFSVSNMPALPTLRVEAGTVSHDTEGLTGGYDDNINVTLP